MINQVQGKWLMRQDQTLLRTDRSRVKLYDLLHQYCWDMQQGRCTKQARYMFSLLFVNQHFQALNNGIGNIIAYICPQLLPVAKRLQNVLLCKL